VQAFARIGLVPDGGTTFVLPRRIGWARAMEMSMLAEPLPAEKALEWGLVNRVFEDSDELMKGAMQTASKLASGPKTHGKMRQLFWSTWHNAYDQQLELEAKVQVQAGQTYDFGEGSDAFRNKRPPEFKGR
ncbi:MAG: 2-(1,2-epoxy-1,2-dihydrophenyl)acetyl-CoA isomerase, partial [Pseudomonadales bacterium]|nr:2-(1,2-epoxy-1,2-dihydrophenyl)acetyl-CoA isomerase [Pseudomonadales bacterium]